MEREDMFKPLILMESPNPLEFNDWKAKFKQWADYPKDGETLDQDMARAQQIAHVSVGPFWSSGELVQGN